MSRPYRYVSKENQREVRWMVGKHKLSEQRGADLQDYIPIFVIEASMKRAIRLAEDVAKMEQELNKAVHDRKDRFDLGSNSLRYLNEMKKKTKFPKGLCTMHFFIHGAEFDPKMAPRGMNESVLSIEDRLIQTRDLYKIYLDSPTEKLHKNHNGARIKKKKKSKRRRKTRT
jgi:hypothetical protein